MTGIVVPGKLYGVMAAGRPAVFVGPEHCETADTIRHAGCGLTSPPGDAEAWSRRSALAADPSLRPPDGRRGRSAFLAAYERNSLLQPLVRAARRAGGASATAASALRRPDRPGPSPFAAPRLASAEAVIDPRASCLSAVR